MTEAEWLTCDDPEEMVRTILPSAGDRKLRLFICACFRRRWKRDEEPTREVVEIGERYADKLATLADIQRGQLQAVGNLFQAHSLAVCQRPQEHILPVMTHEFWLWKERLDRDCALLRDIIGNPFRPIAFDPEWRTSTAIAVARGMYASRDFSAMPILADAFQDAGCDSDDVLSHCRDPQQVHVRGCWVVDLVLGKGGP